MTRTLRKALTVATAFLSMAAAACTDLAVEPKSSITDANVFNDPASYRAFLAKIYAGLAVTGQQGAAGNGDISGIDEGFSQYLRLYWEAQELPTDEAVIGWNDIGLPELNTQTWSSSNLFVNAMFYRVYFQIGLANEFLRQTTDARLDERGVTGTLRSDIQTYRAEARFLRALSYWHGLDLFVNANSPGIPLYTEADLLGTIKGPSSAQDIYDFIVSELTAVRPQLPTPTAANYGRATGPAASMMLAKIYMNAQVYTGTTRWSEALSAAQDVIAGPYSLHPVYRSLFLADNHTSPEIIFAITQDGQRTQTWGGMTFLMHASCGGSMNSSDYGHNGCWWGLRLKPEAYNRYAAGDLRTSYFYTSGQNVALTSRTNFNDGIAAPKFSNRTSTGGVGSSMLHPDTDFPMFRLADAYLIYAEAHLRGGGGTAAQALAYVNAIRQRAYGGPAGDITAAELTLSFILDERGRELLWEGHRRPDLIRYGLYTGGTYLWTFKGQEGAGIATPVTRDIYPLPAMELVVNASLRQNPGY